MPKLQKHSLSLRELLQFLYDNIAWIFHDKHLEAAVEEIHGIFRRDSQKEIVIRASARDQRKRQNLGLCLHAKETMTKYKIALNRALFEDWEKQGYIYPDFP